MEKKNPKNTLNTKAENTINEEVKLCHTICLCYLMYFDVFGKTRLPDENRIREIAQMMIRHKVAVSYPDKGILIDKEGNFLKFPFKEFFIPETDVVNMNLEYFEKGEPCYGCPFEDAVEDF